MTYISLVPMVEGQIPQPRRTEVFEDSAFILRGHTWPTR